MANTITDTGGNNIIDLNSASAGVVVSDPTATGATFGIDIVTLTGGNDDVETSGGDDVISVLAGGILTLSTSGGNDTINVVAGASVTSITADTSNSNDTVELGEGGGSGVTIGTFDYIGGAGADQLVISSAVTVDNFSLTSVESIAVGPGGSLQGDDSANVINLNADSAKQTLVNTSGGDFEVHGNGGADQITGGSFGDILFGGSGADSIAGGNGSDELYGGGGSDVVSGGNGSDIIFGGSNGDMLYGGGGADDIFGGGGNDIIDGGNGQNDLFGGSGDDTFLVSGKNWKLTIDGGIGTDTISLQGDVSFSPNTNISGVEAIETNGFGITGSDFFADSVDFSGFAITGVLAGEGIFYDGRGNNDTIVGSRENDLLLGGSGDDNVSGGNGNDIIIGGLGDDTVTAGAGEDEFLFAVATDGNDTITDFRANGPIVVIADPNADDIVADLAVMAQTTGKLWGIEDGDVLLNSSIGTTFSASLVGGTDLLLDFGNGNSLTFEDTTRVAIGDFEAFGIL